MPLPPLSAPVALPLLRQAAPLCGLRGPQLGPPQALQAAREALGPSSGGEAGQAAGEEEVGQPWSLRPGLKVDLVRHGEFERNGAGAQRRFTPLGVLPSFTEEIVDFEPGQQLSYRLVSGLPFRNYTGEVRLRPIAYGTRIDYTVSADNRLPGVAEAMSHALLFALKRAVQQAVGKVG